MSLQPLAVGPTLEAGQPFMGLFPSLTLGRQQKLFNGPNPAIWRCIYKWTKCFIWTDSLAGWSRLESFGKGNLPGN